MDEACVVEGHSTSIAVRVNGVSKKYGKYLALQNVNLNVPRGEFAGFIGPDGSGKSTLMKAIAGLLTYDDGVIEVFGTPIDSEKSAEKVRNRIGFMPQGLGQSLYPELSVEENIEFFAKLRLVPADELEKRKKWLLSMTRLEPFLARQVKHLSGGMKQKLALICALIHSPELLILDEPTTGVDCISRKDFWIILSQLLHQTNVTALISTAYMDEASRFHQVSLFHHGRVLESGDPDRIAKSSSGCMVVLNATPQLQAISQLKKRYPLVKAYGPDVHAFVENTDAASAIEDAVLALDGVQVQTARTMPLDLEDAFLMLLLKKGLVEKQTSIEDAQTLCGIADEREVMIEAQDLVRDFHQFRAVDSVSFSVQRGEIFGLLGANGAGKTTVLKMLTGILPPTAGCGRVAGADMKRSAQQIKEKIGYMSQIFSLYQDLTVVENIMLFAGIYGLSSSETRLRTQWILEMAGLTGNKLDQTGRLPVGLRQRLALGCALVHQPQVLFLDEPTSGVDPVGRQRFWDILFRLSRVERVSILLTTHSMNDAEHCDRLALMHSGHIIANATPDEMKKQTEAEAGRLFELLVEQPAAVLSCLARNGFEDAMLFGKTIHLFTRDDPMDQKRIESILLRNGWKLPAFQPIRISMEDVFVHRLSALQKHTAPENEAA
jgi:ABC-2 type transport system ATP-binding protein